ncbi:MAG: phosphatidic acid phosphatase [Saprospiraceae bacterium]|jgi:membrane-associated phospholipid phosphatase|nr:phosphatidic acid phosphatase [Saprospiraceae bacterium]MBL0023527.1 phosphatidic acid phosphatase [Saprospiraceae bacterium]
MKIKTVLARAISVILHPMFTIGYVMAFLILANPYLFGFSGEKAEGLIIISVLTISVMFPLIAIVMMNALGLISSLQMSDKKERIGPLIVTGIFYMWLYVNVRNNDNIPAALSFFILGSTISVFLALMINSFSKISLHTIAAGGLLTGMLFIIFNFTYGFADIPLIGTGIQLRMSDRFIFIIILILAGLTGTARLYLKAHTEDEIYGGYIVGILAQMIAFRIFF